MEVPRSPVSHFSSFENAGRSSLCDSRVAALVASKVSNGGENPRRGI